MYPSLGIYEPPPSLKFQTNPFCSSIIITCPLLREAMKLFHSSFQAKGIFNSSTLSQTCSHVLVLTGSFILSSVAFLLTYKNSIKPSFNLKCFSWPTIQSFPILILWPHPTFQARWFPIKRKAEKRVFQWFKALIVGLYISII